MTAPDGPGLPGHGKGMGKSVSRNLRPSAGIQIHSDGESGTGLYMVSMHVVRRRLGMALVRGICRCASLGQQATTVNH